MDSAANRRHRRTPLVSPLFEPSDVDAALDVLALMDLSWHDCYQESAPSDALVEDVLTIAAGDLAALARAAYLVVQDWRDVRVSADLRRSEAADE